MLESRVTQVSFQFEISKISEPFVNCWSPEYTVQGIPWSVKVGKRIVQSKDALGIYLCCAKKELAPNWTHVARASYKLISYDDCNHRIEKCMEPYVFVHSDQGLSNPILFTWEELFAAETNYVKNDAIKIEVKIEAEDPTEPNKSILVSHNMENVCNNCSVKYRLTVKNIQNLMAVRSPKFKFKDLDWSFLLFKDQLTYLRIRMDCSEHVKQSFYTTVKIRLVTHIAGNNLDGQCRIAVNKGSKYIPMKKIISWKRLFTPENGFIAIIANSISLEVEMKTDCLRCDQNNKSQGCAICFDVFGDQKVASTLCGHLFCLKCIEASLKSRDFCPLCNEKVTVNSLRRIYLPQ